MSTVNRRQKLFQIPNSLIPGYPWISKTKKVGGGVEKYPKK
jgi:hypothetical protein